MAVSLPHQTNNKTLKIQYDMKEIEKMNRQELINYTRELMPELRWTFESLSNEDIKEVIRMYFSV